MNAVSCFITGTDTEIGKTTISCALIRALAKKVETGRSGCFPNRGPMA